MLNKSDIAYRFGISASTYETASSAQQRAAQMLSDSMQGVCRYGGRVLEIGCGTGGFTRMMLKDYMPHQYVANDISEPMLEQLVSSTSANNVATLHGDAEAIEWPSGMDAVVSASAVQWFYDPLSFVDRAVASLDVGGVMGLATYGPRTFAEMQSLGVAGLHYPTLEEWRQRVEESGMQLLAAEREMLVLEYPSAMEVMRDLQKAGVTTSEKPLTAGAMRALMKRYDSTYRTTQGTVPLTYDIYIIVAKKR